MKHRTLIAVLMCLVCALTLVPAARAQGNDRDRNNRDDRDSLRYALALGAGVVEPNGTGEVYYSGAFRIRLGGDREREREKGDWRYERRGDIVPYLEPEVGYWERSERRRNDSDLLVGVNAIGEVPGRSVDYFFGVGLGVHFLDTKIDAVGDIPAVDESNEHVGGNFQVGLDIRMSEHASVFGTGRFDVIEGVDDTLQGKVYMGLRFRF